MKEDIKNNELQPLLKNIAWLRRKNGLSKEEMAIITELSIESIDTIENGSCPDEVEIDTVLKIHKYFGVDPMELLTKLLEK